MSRRWSRASVGRVDRPGDQAHRFAALVVLVATVSAFSAVAATPMLGEPLSAEATTGASLTVLPNGAGLPAGSGTASEGRELYTQHCAACHGVDGEGGPNDRLVGGVGSITSEAPVRTLGSYWPFATTIFDYVRRAMPYNAPGSLSDDEVYALTAYLLAANGIIDDGLVIDQASLPAVEMPNRHGFVDFSAANR